jgi:hypothetical protein
LTTKTEEGMFIQQLKLTTMNMNEDNIEESNRKDSIAKKDQLCAA